MVFFCRYNTPQALNALTYEEFRGFARQQGYTNQKGLLSCFGRIQQPQLVASPETVAVYQIEAQLLAGQLQALIQAKRATVKELRNLFAQHPDQGIFASLPGAGDFLAPALLAKFGDDRERFLSAANVQALAGTCPITDASGKSKRVVFRRACDREFRQIAQ